jgi:beta-glucanase (GH16 family)
MSFKTWLTNGWYYVRFYTKVWFTNYFKRDHNNSPDKFGYTLVYADEFNQPINWNTWRSCEQWGCTRDMVIFKQSQVTQSGSDAILTADINNVEGEPKAKAGGLYTWNFFNTTYGYFETREKLAHDGIKYWPAFWLSGKDNWPPEIDIFEPLGNDSSYFTMTLHWRNTWTNEKEIQAIYEQIYQAYGYVATDFNSTIKYLQQPEWTKQKQDFIDALYAQSKNEMKGRRLKFWTKDFLSKDYHIYACEWTEKKVTWFIDNVAVYVLDKHIPTEVMLNLINSNYSFDTSYGPIPSKLPMPIYVDYFRAYKKK